MRQGCLGADYRRGTIVLEVFGRFGLGIIKLRNIELIGVVEEQLWLEDGVDISL